MQANPFPFKRSVRIEMVPLIDCFFLLLVFFIFGVFSMTTQQGIVVDLPSAATSASTREEALTVSLDNDGAIWFHHEAMTLPSLTQRLQHEHATHAGTLVVINAHAAVSHGQVVSVLDAVRRAGFQRVAFQTTPQSP